MTRSSRAGFGCDTTTVEVLEGIDLDGKRALVTGASGGLGAETARALASKGARVVITARDVPKAEEVARGIRASTGNDGIEVEELELGSLASIRAFADRFLARHDAVQILVNNAGVMACPFGKTTDGFEMQFGTNHLGHFLMTGLIAPSLLRGAPARVVSVSSRGVHANAIHPGTIATDLARHMEREDFELVRKRQPGGRMRLKSVEAGAATTVYAATAPELEGRGGLYLEDCGVAKVDDAPDAAGGVRSYALDPDTAKRLWSISEEMVGQSFPL